MGNLNKINKKLMSLDKGMGRYMNIIKTLIRLATLLFSVIFFIIGLVVGIYLNGGPIEMRHDFAWLPFLKGNYGISDVEFHSPMNYPNSIEYPVFIYNNYRKNLHSYLRITVEPREDNIQFRCECKNCIWDYTACEDDFIATIDEPVDFKVTVDLSAPLSKSNYKICLKVYEEGREYNDYKYCKEIAVSPLPQTYFQEDKTINTQMNSVENKNMSY